MSRINSDIRSGNAAGPPDILLLHSGIAALPGRRERGIVQQLTCLTSEETEPALRKIIKDLTRFNYG